MLGDPWHGGDDGGGGGGGDFLIFLGDAFGSDLNLVFSQQNLGALLDVGLRRRGAWGSQRAWSGRS